MTDESPRQPLPRVVTRISGRMTAPNRAEGDRSRVRNISVSGMFVETDAELEVGEQVSLEVVLPGKDITLTISGMVRWKREEPPCGVGVELDEIK